MLCRQALAGGLIDPAGFTTLRLLSGAATLVLIQAARGEWRALRTAGGWGSALALFLYAAPFSFAYVTLGAATGALILFGAVQTTMLVAGARGGERPHGREWIGLAVAVGGLLFLTAPGLTAPPLLGSVLMAGAGMAWGIYSLRGRGESRPLAATAGNFLRAVPPAAALSALLLPGAGLTPGGAVLAVISGSVTSGLGYVLWYAALPGLSATRAAIVQLSVPILAALGGVLLLGETITLRLGLSSVLILGGVGLAVTAARPAAMPVRAGEGAQLVDGSRRRSD